MEPWKQKVEQSLARTKSEELLELLKKKQEDFEVDNEEQDYLGRAILVAEAVLRRLDSSDPRLINVKALEGLGTALKDAITHLNSWTDEDNKAHLTGNLENDLNTTVALLARLTPATDVEEARESIATLRRSVARHRTIVENLIKDISKKGSQADQSIEEKVKEAKDQFEKLQTEISSLDQELSGIKDSSSQVTTEQQTAFTKAEADRSTKFTNLLTEKQKELEQSVKAHSTELAKSLESIRKKVELDETATTEAKERVEEILEIVGDDALIGDYSKTAKLERDDANLWRRIAAGSLGVAIAAAVVFSFLIDSSTAWQQVLAKIVIVASFAGLAGYAAKQSSEHRDAQRGAERMSLQLKAIKPYLGDLTDRVKQDELLIKIADRLFGKEQTTRRKERGKKEANPMDIRQLAEAIRDLVKENRVD